MLRLSSRCWRRQAVVRRRKSTSSSLTLRASSVTDASRRTRRSTRSWYDAPTALILRTLGQSTPDVRNVGGSGHGRTKKNETKKGLLVFSGTAQEAQGQASCDGIKLCLLLLLYTTCAVAATAKTLSSQYIVAARTLLDSIDRTAGERFLYNASQFVAVLLSVN